MFARYLKYLYGTSLAVHLLKLHASDAGYVGSTPGWKTINKIPYASMVQPKKKKKSLYGKWYKQLISK